MTLRQHIARRGKSAVAGALIAAGVGLIVYACVPLEENLAILSFDLPFLVRPGAGSPVSDPVIIYMDESSAKELGQPWTNNLAWSRDIHARLIDRLVRSRVRAIVFDVLFDKTNEQDRILLDAVGRARQARIPVIVGASTRTTTKTGAAAIEELTEPAPPFAALAALADFGMAEEADGPGDKPRRHSRGLGTRPSMAEQVAQITSAGSLGPLPAERWINFYGPAGTFRHWNYAAALDPKRVPDALLAGKVCFIGEGSSEAYPGGKPVDLWNIPSTRWQGEQAFGVEICASVYLNLIRHEWLNRLSVPAECLLIVAGGLFIGLCLTLVRPTFAVALGLLGFLVVATVASWLMWQSPLRLWFCWLVTAGIQIPTALTWSVLLHTRLLARENRDLQQNLARLTEAGAAAVVPGVGALRCPADVPTLVATARSGEGSAASNVTAPPAISDHTLLRCIGKGAYGEVWLARNVIGTHHAVKIIHRRSFDDSGPFEREFRGIQKFMPISRLHPGLVQILHAGRNDAGSFFYYVMEPADDEQSGAQIDPASYSPKHLAREVQRRGRLTVAECLELGLRLSDALDFLHSQQLIHRDLKPSNIIFVRGQPKLADIGLVTTISTSKADASFVGTRGYIPPEGPGQPAADVFSLGRVLYEAGMGLRCDQFPTLPETLVNSSEGELALELNQIILKACEENPAQRYSSAAEMHGDLLALQERLRRLPGQDPQEGTRP